MRNNDRKMKKQYKYFIFQLSFIVQKKRIKTKIMEKMSVNYDNFNYILNKQIDKKN